MPPADRVTGDRANPIEPSTRAATATITDAANQARFTILMIGLFPLLPDGVSANPKPEVRRVSLLPDLRTESHLSSVAELSGSRQRQRLVLLLRVRGWCCFREYA